MCNKRSPLGSPVSMTKFRTAHAEKAGSSRFSGWRVQWMAPPARRQGSGAVSDLRPQRRADLALREIAGATKLVGSANNAHGDEFTDRRIEVRAPGCRRGRRLRLRIAPLPSALDDRPVEAVERADRHRLRRVQGCGTLLESRPLNTANGSHGETEIDALRDRARCATRVVCYAASFARSASRRQNALVEVAFAVAGVAVDSSARLAASSRRNCWLTLTRAISLSIVPRSRSTAASLSSIA